MATRGPDATDPAGGGPTRHSFRIDPEQGSDLAWGQQALARALHVFSPPLSHSCGGRTVSKCAGSRPVSPLFSPNITVRSLVTCRNDEMCPSGCTSLRRFT